MADLTNTAYGDLSGFKSYADWQAANRAAGGSGNSSQVAALFGGAPAGPMASTGGQAIPGGGTTPYTGPADTTKWQTGVAMTDAAHPDASGPSGDPFVDMIRGGQHGSEDYARFSNAQILAWKDKYIPGTNPPKFYNDFGDVVDKPTESGPNSQAAGYSTGERDAGTRGGGGGGGGYGGYDASGGMGGGGGYGPAGGVPMYHAPTFKPPTAEEAFNDPGYQFSLEQGLKGLQGSAAARGVLRTGGTLKDILDFGQRAAAQQYGDVYNRRAQEFGFQTQGAKDEFAPQFSGWQTMYGGDLSKYLNAQDAALSKWSTRYGGDLQRDLQRESNIYGIINQPPPQAPIYNG